MSLSIALTGALNGLRISSKRAETVASNVGNAGVDGYARRSVEVTPLQPPLVGSRLNVVRNEHAPSVTLRREADGQAAGAGVLSEFWSGLDVRLGDPDSAQSLSARLVAFEAATVDATARPGSPERLAAVSQTADDLARAISDASDDVVARRSATERAISTEVDGLNADLHAVRDLNIEIARASATKDGTTRATLEDQRSVVLDRISDRVGIRVLQRDLGAIAVISEGGQILLDGNVQEVSFSGALLVEPDDTVVGGSLHRPMVGDREIPTPPRPTHIGGGRLEALFRLRDEDAPAAQAHLDGLARELIARFSDSGVDPTLTGTEPGLFADSDVGGTEPPEGLAGRLIVNPLANPGTPGGHWRIRDGFGAAAMRDDSAPVGNLDAMLDALSAVQAPADAAAFGTAPRTVGGLASGVKSLFSSMRARADDVAATAAATARTAAARDAEASGVDVDEEMRRLIEIEQSYAAAAKVIEAVDEMMDRLTRI